MKLHLRASVVVVFLVIVVPFGAAAEPTPVGQTIQIEVERQRIAQQRSLQEAAFAQAEQVCFTRFAVSDCLRQARMDRRVVLNELRRQELVLNALDRQGKALAELNRISENVSNQQREQQEFEK